MATTNKYLAKDQESYARLANYAAALPVTVTLFPLFNTIVIAEEAKFTVGQFIDENALDFSIEVNQTEVDDIDELLDNPTTGATILHEIAETYRSGKKTLADQNREMQIKLESETKYKDDFYKYWMAAESKNDKIGIQIKAIASLMKAIFNEE